MKILVDADACPVKSEIENIAKNYGISVCMFIDTSHILKSDYSEIITVDKASDSVDIALINHTDEGDVIVTQDYGVAAMALGKKAYAINQNGLIYTAENIDRLLFERHIGKKVRRSGGRTGTIKKRCADDDKRFRENFTCLIEKILNNGK